jgi:hypothetical protein
LIRPNSGNPRKAAADRDLVKKWSDHGWTAQINEPSQARINVISYGDLFALLKRFAGKSS